MEGCGDQGVGEHSLDFSTRQLLDLSGNFDFCQNATILLKMRILHYDLNNLKKFVKSRHDIILSLLWNRPDKSTKIVQYGLFSTPDFYTMIAWFEKLGAEVWC